ncbi:MAG: hypothetical protein EXQ85_04485 [Alphaproteobacteria bacterium]|nr:hypothetical protein [Alphaproteobacteria bacterium]
MADDKGGRGIISITRHPVMWGIATWAAAHLLANGSVAGIIFFCTLLGLSLFGPLLTEARKQALMPEAGAKFVATTSYVPFVAMAGGRARLSLAAIGWWRVALAIVVYAVLLYLHPRVIGVGVLPGRRPVGRARPSRRSSGSAPGPRHRPRRARQRPNGSGAASCLSSAGFRGQNLVARRQSQLYWAFGLGLKKRFSRAP